MCCKISRNGHISKQVGNIYNNKDKNAILTDPKGARLAAKCKKVTKRQSSCCTTNHNCETAKGVCKRDGSIEALDRLFDEVREK